MAPRGVRGDRPLGSLIDGTARRAGLALTGQGLCLGLGVHLATVALAIAEGAALAAADTHLVGLVAGVAAGVAWRRAHCTSAGRIARKADAALGLDGALVAAYEEEGRDPGGAFAALGARRVLVAARPSALREAGQPNAVPFAAAPIAGAVLLALVAAATADRRASEGPWGLGLAGVAADELATALAAVGRAGAASPDELRALAVAASEARVLAALVGRGGPDSAGPGAGGAAPGGSDPSGSAAASDSGTESSGPAPDEAPFARPGEALERTAEALARDVDGLAGALAGAPPAVRAALERAALALDTLSLGAGLDATPPGPEASPGPALAHTAADDGTSSVTSGAPGVTMSGSGAADAAARERPQGGPGSDSAARPMTPPDGTEGRDAEGGVARSTPEGSVPDAAPLPAVAAGRPWPRRYDGLVARWGARRSSASPTRPPTDPSQQ